MSGLKQKAKTTDITHGKLSIVCANCNLDRTKEKNPLSTHCPICGFNPSFPNIIPKRLMRAEEEIAKLKDLLKSYNDQALAYEKSVEETLGQIREIIFNELYFAWNTSQWYEVEANIVKLEDGLKKLARLFRKKEG